MNDLTAEHKDPLQEGAEPSFKSLQKHLGDTPIAPAHGIAALALDMALKYHDINTIKDGVLYQQYKLEGRNMRDLHLDVVFETAIKMENYLLGASDRIAKVVVEALAFGIEDAEQAAPIEGDVAQDGDKKDDAR